jgi:hypothetical protein
MEAMAKPLTDDERARIVALMAEGKGRREIARTVERSTTTITRVAAEIGHDWLASADARTQSTLSRAHEARGAYCAERRASLAAKATEEAERLLAELHGDYLVFNFGGRDNTFAKELLAEPPIEAKRAMVQSFRELIRTVLDIDRHDNRADEGGAAVDEWLRSIVGEVAA